MPKSVPLTMDLDEDTVNNENEQVTDFTLPNEEIFADNEIDLDSITFDEAQLEADKKRMTAPAGDWVKSEEWSFDKAKNIHCNVEDREKGDVNLKGRTTYMLFGYPDERSDKEGNTFRPFMKIQLSPDKRMHREKEDQFDHRYKMWVLAWDLFVHLYERKPKGHGELLRCLAEDTYVLNTMNGDDGPFVLRVKPVRKQR
ncbi:MAG: hypothetical protein ACRCZI_07510 [Cetobacterium sp.]